MIGLIVWYRYTSTGRLIEATSEIFECNDTVDAFKKLSNRINNNCSKVDNKNSSDVYVPHQVIKLSVD